MRRHANGDVETPDVRRTPVPSFSPPRESRALSLRRHANGDVETPDVRRPPISSFSPRRESRALIVRRHANGNGETAGVRRTPVPSFSPPRESRALIVRRHANGNGETAGVRWPAARHSRRRGNPEPFLPSNLMRVCRNDPDGPSTFPTGSVLVGITVSAHSRGSGFPLRRKIRGRSGGYRVPGYLLLGYGLQ